MKKKLMTFMCILLVLSMLVGMLVACEQTGPEIPPPIVPETPPLVEVPEDPTLDEVPILFEPMGLFNELSKYNGEKGVGDDTYYAVLKVKVATESGVANAAVVISQVFITFKMLGVPIVTEATPEEFVKFSLETTRLSKITTEPKEEMLRVKFGDFSNEKYYGATFSFVLQATAMSEINQ